MEVSWLPGRFQGPLGFLDLRLPAWEDAPLGMRPNVGPQQVQRGSVGCVPHSSGLSCSGNPDSLPARVTALQPADGNERDPGQGGREKSSWPESQLQGPCLIPGDCSNSFPSQGFASLLQNMQFGRIGLCTSFHLDTCRVETTAAGGLSPCHRAAPMRGGGRGTHLPTLSQGCLPVKLRL